MNNSNPSKRIETLAYNVLQAAQWPISSIDSKSKSPTPYLDELEKSLEIHLPPLNSINDNSGVLAGFVHIFNHALIKGGLFMAAGYLAISLNDRVTLESIEGYGQKYPITSYALLVCGLSLIGLPLTNGFISKLYIFQALYSNEMFLTIGLVALSSALAVIYFWKIVEKLFFSSKGYEATSEDPAIYIPIWIIALSIIYFGIFSSTIVEFSSIASESLILGGSN